MKAEEVLFALLRSAVAGTALGQDVKDACAPEMLDAVYALASPQGLAGAAAQVLADSGLLGDNAPSKKLRASAMQAFCRYGQQNYELESIFRCLEDAKVCYIPLKGAVVRKYYPQPWMRTSCDIDILVREEDLDRAVEALKQGLGYTQPHARSYHDISLFSKSGVHLELHFSLKEHDKRLDSGLTKAWEYAVAEKQDGYRYALRADFFVYHLVAHTAYHFTSAGCGARPVLDLWLLKHKMGYDEESVKALCAVSQITPFYEALQKLAEVWFSGAQSTVFLDRMGSYILHAGFGGSQENAVAAGVLKNGSKRKYVLSRLFLPIDILQQYYPILQKHRWLMPLCQIRRWFDALARRRLSAAVEEFKTSRNVDQQKADETAELFSLLGLM